MGQDKLWVDVGGRPLAALTLRAAADAACFDAVVIAAPEQRWQAWRALARESGLGDVMLLEGGVRRQDSVRAALSACTPHELVCVHDAARPLAAPRLFSAVIDAARVHGAATTAVPVVDTIKRVRGSTVVETLPRAELVATQTPQAFRTDVLVRAHDAAATRGVVADDDCALVELLGEHVEVVAGDERNIKVTHPRDLDVVRAAVVGDA